MTRIQKALRRLASRSAVFINSPSQPRHAQTRKLPEGHFSNAVRLPDGTDAPDFIRIVPVGDWPFHQNGPHAIDADAIGEMVANFAGRDTDLLIDFDHESRWGGTRAAGWITEVVAREDGLYARYPEYTKSGTEAIAHREYRYFSPVYYRRTGKDGLDKGWALHSIALTNLPYFDEGEIDSVGNAAPSPSPTADTPDTTMDRDELARLLELDPKDITDEMISNSIQTLKANQKAPEAPAPASDPAPDPDPSSDPEAGQSMKINARIDALEKSQSDQAKTAAQERAESLVDQAIANGKILPNQKTVYLNGAKVDFDQTKAALDAMKANSAMPGSVQTPDDRPSRGPAPLNSRDKVQDYVNSFYPV